ncbi:MAG: phosphoglucosamine mutase [Actinomycetota bacterium]
MLRFGTDGVRGDADADLTDDLVVAFGRAVVPVLGSGRFLVGRDTRESGARIEAALCTGLALAGADVVALGVLPTPAIAYEAQIGDAPAAVISASHNKWTDNGIKLLAAGGRKLADDVEQQIERALDATLTEARPDATPTWSHEDAGDEYIGHVVASIEGRMLDDMRVVVDCANGAAFEVAPEALRRLGAEVVTINAAPNGRNINDGCGSTHPDGLRAAVREHRAIVGLALDGDADRVIAVDEWGELVDGDQLMTAFAIDLRERGLLRNNAIVITVMSNLGLREALASAGIGLVETPVGDRSVLAALAEHDLMLGGEQSGHIIRTDLATTGDGLLTGVLACDLVRRSAQPLSALAAQMERFPQVLVGVRVAGRPDLARADALWDAVRAAERALGHAGRVLVRASGTEPLVRVMVEARSATEAAAVAERLRQAIQQAFPAS